MRKKVYSGLSKHEQVFIQFLSYFTIKKVNLIIFIFTKVLKGPLIYRAPPFILPLLSKQLHVLNKYLFVVQNYSRHPADDTGSCWSGSSPGGGVWEHTWTDVLQKDMEDSIGRTETPGRSLPPALMRRLHQLSKN